MHSIYLSIYLLLTESLILAFSSGGKGCTLPTSQWIPPHDRRGELIFPSETHIIHSSNLLLFSSLNSLLSANFQVYKALLEKTKSIPGASVEHNKFCLSVHFRCVDEKVCIIELIYHLIYNPAIHTYTCPHTYFIERLSDWVHGKYRNGVRWHSRLDQCCSSTLSFDWLKEGRWGVPDSSLSQCYYYINLFNKSVQGQKRSKEDVSLGILYCLLQQVLEIRPTIKWDKGKALEFLLESLGEFKL